MKATGPACRFMGWIFLLVLVASPLGATCTCTATASASAPDLQFSGRSAGACARLTRLAMGIDGGSGLGTVAPPPSSTIPSTARPP